MRYVIFAFFLSACSNVQEVSISDIDFFCANTNVETSGKRCFVNRGGLRMNVERTVDCEDAPFKITLLSGTCYRVVARFDGKVVAEQLGSENINSGYFYRLSVSQKALNSEKFTIQK